MIDYLDFHACIAAIFQFLHSSNKCKCGIDVAEHTDTAQENCKNEGEWIEDINAKKSENAYFGKVKIQEADGPEINACPKLF